MVFKQSATKLLTIHRMAAGEYVPKLIDKDKVMTEHVPVALKIVHDRLREESFCDRFLTPLVSLARQVSDLLMEEHGCNDPAAVSAAILADLNQTREVEQEIKAKLGDDTLKVWKEVKLLLDVKTCQVDFYKSSLNVVKTVLLQEESHKTDDICVDKNCKLSWLQGRHFSVSACIAVGGWCCLLARLVTEVHTFKL